jgi:hypothetical protein
MTTSPQIPARDPAADPAPRPTLLRPAPRAARIAAVAAAAAIGASPSATRADLDAAERAPRAELAAGAHHRALRSPSANAVTGDNLGGIALSLARDLGLRASPRLGLWATAGLSRARAQGALFRSLAAEVDALGIAAGLGARYRAHARVAAGARLELGAARAALRLEDPQGRGTEDAAWGGLVVAAASVDLFAIAGPRAALGVRLELGYAAAAPIALSARATAMAGPSASDLPETAAPLGALDLSGRFAGAAIVLRR